MNVPPKDNERIKKVREILRDEALDVQEVIEKVKDILVNMDDIGPELVREIDMRLKGRYGSEYLVTKGDPGSLIPFYSFMNAHFPHSAETVLSLADLYLLDKQYEKGFALFKNAFSMKPSLVFQAPGELYDLLTAYGSEEQVVYYRMAIVRALISEGELEGAREEYRDIVEQYGEHHPLVEKYLREEGSFSPDELFRDG